MSPAELAWRLRSVARDWLDRPRFAMGLFPGEDVAVSGEVDWNRTAGFTVTDVDPGSWGGGEAGQEESLWCERLVVRARKIVEHRFSFFDLDDCYLGNPVDWNKDHGNGINAPLCFAQAIDYRDFKVTGDCKLVWEPNRHHQLVVLGRAYRASGEVSYAREIVAQMESWMDQCPFGRGMNWRSPLELGIRLINWVWALDLIKDSGQLSAKFNRRLLHNIHLHLWEITRKYSRGSSANNHLVGEAAGVFIATSYFSALKNAARWRAESREILQREIIAQTYPSGFTREQATGYHLFVLQFFLLAGLVARWTGDDFPAEYWQRLEKMFAVVRLMAQGGELPMIGDGDDGYVLNLGQEPNGFRDLLAAGAIVFNRSDFARVAGGCKEYARWLLGSRSRERFTALYADSHDLPLESTALRDAGLYFLQHESISVIFDCGELGFGPIAAHGHADALGFTLRVGAVDVLVDPGTYDYFSYPQWRKYFRSTRSHNTLMVDNQDQSVMLGPFLWGARAAARCLEWAPRQDGGVVCGEHDGYCRLDDPVIHRRTLELEGSKGVLGIKDEVVCSAGHEVSLCFQFSEHCRVEKTAINVYRVRFGGGELELEVDRKLDAILLKGSTDPIGGWVSRKYHVKAPAAAIVCRARIKGTQVFMSRLTVKNNRKRTGHGF